MNKVALITGASGGIGYEFAQLLAKDQYNLVLVSRSEDKLEHIKKDLENRYGIQVIQLPWDLSYPETPEKIYEYIKSKKIAVEVLINNAGVGTWGAFAQSDWKRESATIQINMVTVAQLIHLFLPNMLRQGKGKILNIASTAAFQPGPLMAGYYASKAYVLSLSEAIANEIKGSGVSVTTLCPGPTQTGFQSAASVKPVKLFSSKKLPTAKDVAEYGYQAMLAGKTIAVHGMKNKILVFLVRFLPRSITTHLVKKMQESRN